jgi:uncharacterized protein (DUF2141 family)
MRWLIVFVCLSWFPSRGQDIRVNISKIKHTGGEVVVALFDREQAFLKKPLKVVRVKPNSASAEAVFTALSPGDYAISVFHDLNGNDTLDGNMLGIPQEAFGFSNNVMGFFGPPSFRAARFRLGLSDLTLPITLRHY